MVAVATTWQHFQVRFSEWFVAIVMFGIGVYITLHPGMMTDPRSGILWTGMVGMMSQESWGLAAAIIGGARLGALYVNGHHARTPTIRLIAAFFSAFFFTQLTVGLLKSGLSNTGVVTYACVVLADIYSGFRASQDVTFVSRRNRPIVTESGRDVGRIVEKRT